MGINKLWAWYPHLWELCCSAPAVAGIIQDWKDGAQAASQFAKIRSCIA
jgi:hypothetical protein